MLLAQLNNWAEDGLREEILNQTFKYEKNRDICSRQVVQILQNLKVSLEETMPIVESFWDNWQLR